MDISEAKKIWENRLSKDWSLTGVGYTALGKGFNVWAYKVRGVVFDGVLSKLTFSNKTAFDIGSGTGFYVARLLKRGFEVGGRLVRFCRT